MSQTDSHNRWRIISCVVLVSIFFLGNLPAQEIENDEPHNDFIASTTMGIGLSGTFFKTSFRLVDELGLQYDVRSLLTNKSIREKVGVSESQMQQIEELHDQITTELQSLAPAAIAAGKGSKDFEPRFREFQEAMRSVLEPEQRSQLDLAKHQLGIQQFGLEKYLASKAMQSALGLSKDELNSIAQFNSQANSPDSQLTQKLIEVANKELLSRLNDEQHESFEAMMSDSTQSRFVSSPLFVSNKTLQNKPAITTRFVLSSMRSKRFLAKLEINPESNESLSKQSRELRGKTIEEIQKELRNVLNKNELARFNNAVIETETKRYGTVNSLCFGLAGQLMGFAQAEKEELLDSGKEIQKQLSDKVASSKLDALHEALREVSADKREKIIDLYQGSIQ